MYASPRMRITIQSPLRATARGDEFLLTVAPNGHSPIPNHTTRLTCAATARDAESHRLRPDSNGEEQNEQHE